MSNETPLLTDILSKTSLLKTYAGLTRDFPSAHSQLNDPSKRITVLAPRNSTVHELPHKPWENPQEYERFGEVQAYAGREGHDRARENLRRFVEAHIVPVCPWGEGVVVKTLGGKEVKWVRGEGGRMVVSVLMVCAVFCFWVCVLIDVQIQPGDIEVSHVEEQASNGEVWILNGVLDSR